MKNAKTLSVAVLLMASACAGIRARNNVALPAMQLAWAGMNISSIQPGIQKLPPVEAAQMREEAQRMENALGLGDRSQVFLVNWARLKQVAEDGIRDRLDRGELSLGAAASLMERVRLFDRAYVQVVSR